MPAFLPPCSFIAASVDLAVVATAQWNSEFIADLAIERPALRKSEVMGIRRASAANQAGMLSDKFDVIPVTHSAGFRHASALLSIARERRRLFVSLPFIRFIRRPRRDPASAASDGSASRAPRLPASPGKPSLRSWASGGGQLVLLSEVLMGPGGRVIT